MVGTLGEWNHACCGRDVLILIVDGNLNLIITGTNGTMIFKL